MVTILKFLTIMSKDPIFSFVLGFTSSQSYLAIAAAAAKSLQWCLTLCDPTDGSPPDSPIPGILQARTLEWVAMSFSSAWKWSCSVVSNSSRLHGLQPTRLLLPWGFPGKSTGAGCHRLLCNPTLSSSNLIWPNRRLDFYLPNQLFLSLSCF